MLLVILSVGIMLAVAYAYLREGLFTASLMCCNVFIAGLVAINFFEPLASLLEPNLAEGLHGYEDALCLLALFCVTLGTLRTTTNFLARTQVEFPAGIQRGGGALVGLLTGYLVAGFLLIMLQTLPWHENFMNFTSEVEVGGSPMRRVLPPDRMWLALMCRAGAVPFANQADGTAPENAAAMDRYFTFDRSGSFEVRYARVRRYGSDGKTKPYEGEFDMELRKGQ